MRLKLCFTLLLAAAHPAFSLCFLHCHHTPQKIPLDTVILQVEQALDAYQALPEVARGRSLPPLSLAEFDFKTIIDTKVTGGVGVYLFALGGSRTKDKTTELDFIYAPGDARYTLLPYAQPSLQTQLIETLKQAATAVQQVPTPRSCKDLALLQLSVLLSFGVQTDLNGGLNAPIQIVTLSAALDRARDSVQTVRLTFAPPQSKACRPDAPSPQQP